MLELLDRHPAVFTILGIPVVLTACIVVLLVCVALLAQFVEVHWKRK